MIGSGIPRPGRAGPRLVRCGGGGSRAGAPVPLGDGFVGWGRQLRGVRVAFYDRFDPEHVEDRLRDRRAGRPNKWAESLALKD